MYKIAFETPDIPTLVKQYTVVDMHFHSQFSDGADTIEDIVEHTQKLGIGIAVTDHNEIQGAVALNRYKNVLSIPGIEVTSREGTHTLVYFYNIKSLERFYHKDIVPFMGRHMMSSISLPMEEIVQRARHFKAVVVFPHPYCAAYTGIQNSYFPTGRLNRLLDRVDGVEVINAANLNKWNMRCALLGFNLNRAMTGGSDGHLLNHMAKAVTFADCQRSRGAFLDAVKARRNWVIGKEIDVLRKVATNGLKLRSNIRNYSDLVEKNLKYGYTVINIKSRNLKENVKRSLNGRKNKALSRK